MGARTSIEVLVRFTGKHSWPGAQSVISFLSYPHVHEFTITAVKEVTHTDRDIEFYMFKAELEHYVDKLFAKDVLGILNMDTMSCEELSRLIGERFGLSYCKVSEDGQFGGIYERV